MSLIKLKHEKTKYVYKSLVLDWCFLPNLAELLLNTLSLLNSFFLDNTQFKKLFLQFHFWKYKMKLISFFQIYIYIFFLF